jgi:hypothetical protein
MKRLVYLGYLATDSTYVSDGAATRTELSASDHLELQQVDMQVGSTAQRCVNRSYVMCQAVISSDRDPDRPP